MKAPDNDSMIPHDSNKREALLKRMRHSCAHIMAQAVIERFCQEGPIRLGIGPATDDGFYYDFELPRPLKEDDLNWIEERMKSIIRSNCRFEHTNLSVEEARRQFENQPYKLELIDSIARGLLDDNAEAPATPDESEGVPGSAETFISIYRHDVFSDLCKGPHVENSSEINPDAVKVLSAAGAYWRGSERNAMLQRIYGTVFPTVQELDSFLSMLDEAKKRDHRVLGKRLELFHFDESAKGMPYWLPNGMVILNELLAFWRSIHKKEGYQEISTPLLNDRKLWQISGHWEHYKENMFLIGVDDDTVYGLKPMNCPNAMVVFGLKLRSYRDLPMRLADCDILHRHERSGTLSGLFRVQKFQQDDAHIFVEPSQIEDEFERILNLADRFYSVFDLTYSFRLSLRPDSFVGDPTVWDDAEKALARILNKRVGEGNYVVAEKEGAFYGPKIDILMQDSLGRKWQMGTIQLDFQLPLRFNLKYIDRAGKARTPVVIHRVIYGSIDRFVGILLEHTNGELPLWLSPLHAVIVPVADRHIDFGRALQTKLIEAGIRVKIDDSDARMNRKIRQAQLMKIPYVVVIGDTEMERGCLSLRQRNGQRQSGVSLEELIEKLKKEIAMFALC